MHIELKFIVIEKFEVFQIIINIQTKSVYSHLKQFCIQAYAGMCKIAQKKV